MRPYSQTLVLLAIGLSLWVSPAWSHSSVWKVQKGDNVVYLGGTIHLLRPTDFPLPPEFNRAYAASQRVFFETNIAAMSNPDIQAQLMASTLAPPGKTLKDLLTPKTYRRLADAAHKYGADINLLDRFKAGMAIATLQSMALKRLGMSTQGVDMLFYKRAQQDHRPIGQLEKLQAQFDYIGAMGEGWEENFVKLSLQDLDKSTGMIDEISRAWRDGDLDKLNTLFIADMKQDYPRAYHNLIVKRNRHWMPQILHMFKQPGTELVLVGVAHMVGDDGLLRQLERKGYKISPL